MEEMTQPTTAELMARNARHLYCQAMRAFLSRQRGQRSDYGDRHMPQWDGGERPVDGRTFKPVWPKLAQFAVDHNCSLDELIEVAFEKRAGGEPPTPHQVASMATIALLSGSSRRRDGARQAASDLESQAALARTQILLRSAYKRLGWSDDDVIRNVLSDESLSLSSLFRYCLSVKEGFFDLAERYAAMARIQYMGAPRDYSSAWIGWLPDDLGG